MVEPATVEIFCVRAQRSAVTHDLRVGRRLEQQLHELLDGIPRPAEAVSRQREERTQWQEAREALDPVAKRPLRVGVASEAGLQANTIVAARAVSARFPQIAEIDGVRPDPKPWHPSGLAIDIMIPNPSSPEGIALGDEILAFAMSHVAQFGLQDVIWRGTYYTPGGPAGSGYGHYDHVHITTTPRR